MSYKAFDLAIIGAGSGGLAAARRAAEGGRSVVVFESGAIGGTCVNAGCVPKKLLVHASRMADALSEAPYLGWPVAPVACDWPALAARVAAKVRELSQFHRKQLEELGVTIVDARATLSGPTTVRTGCKRYDAKRILIATGARPLRPPILGAEHALVSDDLFSLDRLPRRLAIIGGGYIAVEFACMMRRFGVEVRLHERSSRLIGSFDPDVADRLLAAMRNQGIRVDLETSVVGIDPGADVYRLATEGEHAPGSFDAVLLAAGRRPNTDGLGLGELGIEMTDDGRIVTNADGRTNVEAVYAAGDAAERIALTPVAVRGARRAIDIMFNQDTGLPPAETVPTAVFSTPECGAVGLTAEVAEQLGHRVETRTTSFTPLTGLLSDTGEQVFMKAVIESETGRLLGLHFLGPHASEAAQLGAVALGSRLTENELHHAMPLHPTLGEEVLGLGRRDEPLHQRPRI